MKIIPQNLLHAKAGRVLPLQLARVFFAAFVMSIFPLTANAVPHTVEGSDITESEWQSWPSWCKAVFLASEWANSSKFRGRLTGTAIDSERKSFMATYGVHGPHHLCLAIIYINRARSMTNEKGEFSPRKNLIKKAINEISYSEQRTPKTAPGISLLNAYRGIAFHLNGESTKAIAAWEEGIRLQPSKKDSYLAWAQSLIADKNYLEAHRLLSRYDKSKEYETADGEYFIGFTLYKLGKKTEAKERIDKAHALGYPFPGLKKKIDAEIKSTK